MARASKAVLTVTLALFAGLALGYGLMWFGMN